MLSKETDTLNTGAEVVETPQVGESEVQNNEEQPFTGNESLREMLNAKDEAERPGEGEAEVVEVEPFDGEKFAKENGIDPNLLKGKSEREAVALLAKRLKYRDQQIEKRHKDELTRLQQDLEAARTSRTTPPAQTATNTDEAYQRYLQVKQLAQTDPAKANEWYQEWHDRDPLAASSWLARCQAIEQNQAGEERFAKLEAKLKSLESMPQSVRMEAEIQAFKNKHPDLAAEEDTPEIESWRETLEEVDGLVKDAMLEDVFGLHQLKGDDEAYQYVLGLMKQGIKFAKAKHFLDLERRASNAGGRAEAVVKTAKAAASPGGRGAGVPTLTDRELDKMPLRTLLRMQEEEG